MYREPTKPVEILFFWPFVFLISAGMSYLLNAPVDESVYTGILCVLATSFGQIPSDRKNRFTLSIGIFIIYMALVVLPYGTGAYESSVEWFN